VQAIKRNLKRFPDGFMFQLTWEAAKLLKSQSAILQEPSRLALRSQFVTTFALMHHPSCHYNNAIAEESDN